MAKLTAEEVEKKMGELEACLKDREKDCTDLKAEVNGLKSQLTEKGGENPPSVYDPEVVKKYVEECVGSECDKRIPKAVDDYHIEKWKEQEELMKEQGGEEEEPEEEEEEEEDVYCVDCSLNNTEGKNVKYGEDGCEHEPE